MSKHSKVDFIACLLAFLLFGLAIGMDYKWLGFLAIFIAGYMLRQFLEEF